MGYHGSRLAAKQWEPPAIHHLENQRLPFSNGRIALRDDARDALLDHDWPGNLRELRHVAERASLLVSGDSLGARDLFRAGLPKIGDPRP